MRKQLFRIALKELLIQFLTLLLAWATVNFLLPAEVLHHNLWGTEEIGRPLKTEYMILILMGCNMIRLSLLSLLILLKKEFRQKHKRLSYIYSHH